MGARLRKRCVDRRVRLALSHEPQDRRPIAITSALDKLHATTPEQRSTVRSAAAACGLALSTLHRRVAGGEVKAVTTAAKPLVSAHNMEQRHDFCLSFIDPVTLHFNDVFDVIYVDEKQFATLQVGQRCYLSQRETRLSIAVINKRFVPKVMFFTAVARPRWIECGVHFDDKLVI